MPVAAFSGIVLWISPFAGTYPFFSVAFSLFFLRFYQKDWQKMILLSSIEFVTALISDRLSSGCYTQRKAGFQLSRTELFLSVREHACVFLVSDPDPWEDQNGGKCPAAA